MPSGRKSTTGVKYINQLANGKYRVQGKANGVRIQKGQYDTLQEAIAALEGTEAEVEKQYRGIELCMPEEEIKERYKWAKDKNEQVLILANLNACSRKKIREILGVR